MKCNEIFEKLSSYIDKELDAAEGKKVDSHLATCPMCLVFLNTLKKTIEIFKGKPHAGIPDDLAKNLRAKIKGEMGKNPQ